MFILCKKKKVLTEWTTIFKATRAKLLYNITSFKKTSNLNALDIRPFSNKRITINHATQCLVQNYKTN